MRTMGNDKHVFPLMLPCISLYFTLYFPLFYPVFPFMLPCISLYFTLYFPLYYPVFPSILPSMPFMLPATSKCRLADFASEVPIM